MKCTFSCSM